MPEPDIDYDSVKFIVDITGVGASTVSRKAVEFNDNGRRRCRRYKDGRLYLHRDFLEWLEEGEGAAYPNAMRVPSLPPNTITAKLFSEAMPFSQRANYERIRTWVSDGTLPAYWYKRRLYLRREEAEQLNRALQEMVAPGSWVQLRALAEEIEVSFSKVAQTVKTLKLETRTYHAQRSGRPCHHIHSNYVELVKANVTPQSVEPEGWMQLRRVAEELEMAYVDVVEVVTDLEIEVGTFHATQRGRPSAHVRNDQIGQIEAEATACDPGLREVEKRALERSLEENILDGRTETYVRIALMSADGAHSNDIMTALGVTRRTMVACRKWVRSRDAKSLFRGFLSPDERVQIADLLRRNLSARERTRLNILRLLDRGADKGRVSSLLGCSRPQVAASLAKYRSGGVPSLLSKRTRADGELAEHHP